MLISKAIVEGHGEEGGRYTLAQRHRLLREGAREFFRVGERPIEFMGDCGAFTYVKEKVPPVTVDEVIDFYDACGVDYGVSVDHIILAFQPELDGCIPGLDVVPESWRERQDVTLEFAASFLKQHAARKSRFTPVGVAQGWSPRSYAHCVDRLQKMGYRYIGLGGMVSLKSKEILACLSAAGPVRRSETKLHLFGVSRCEHIEAFSAYGVASFDSTSPLRQAFKHDRENYYTAEKLYAAVRVPQVEGNNKLQQRIISGAVKQEEARRLEQACLKALKNYDRMGEGLERCLALLREYDLVHDGRKDRTGDNRTVLQEEPWKRCPCEICRRLGIHVVLFRGAERNRRRGFHNLFVTYGRVHAELARIDRAGGPSHRAPDRARTGVAHHGKEQGIEAPGPRGSAEQAEDPVQLRHRREAVTEGHDHLPHRSR
jgi:hypothetical protein